MNKLRKTKLISGLLALAIFSPTLAVIAENVDFKSLMTYADEKINILNDGFSHVYASYDSESYYEDTNTGIRVSTPKENGYTVRVKFCLDKVAEEQITIAYHTESFTAINGFDFEGTANNDTDNEYIPAGKDYVYHSFTIKFDEDETDGVTAGKSTFGVKEGDTITSRVFKVVIDSAKGERGTEYKIYNGEKSQTDEVNTGYYKPSNSTYKFDNVAYLSTGYTYTYELMDQRFEGSENLKMFKDYDIVMSQMWGKSGGTKENNSYDCGVDGDNYSGDDPYGDKEKGRDYMPLKPFKSVPYKYHVEDEAHGKNGTPHDWLNRIVKSGLGHSFGSFEITTMDETWKVNDDSYLTMYVGDYAFAKDATLKNAVWAWDTQYDYGKQVEKGYLKENNWTMAINVAMNKKNSAFRFTEDSLINALDFAKKHYADNSVKPDKDYYKGYAANEGAKCGVNKEVIVNSSQVIDYKRNIHNDVQKLGWIRLPHNDTADTFGMSIFFYAPNLGDWWPTSDWRIKGMTHFTVLDDVAPSVVKYSLETQPLLNENKIRLCLRFSEPVQNFENTYFTGACGKNGKGDKLSVEFVPAKDQIYGSDTVVYEADCSSLYDIMVTNIELSNLKYRDEDNEESQYIRDFAQNGGNHVDPTGFQKIVRNLAVTIDRQLPVVRVSEDKLSSTKPVKSPSVPLTISRMRNGTVYYQFLKEEANGSAPEAPEEYPTYLSTETAFASTLGITSNNGTNTYNVAMEPGMNRNGNFYLYAKLVSEYGLVTYLNSDEQNPFGKPIGPYNVDNIAPKLTVSADPAEGKMFNPTQRDFLFTMEEDNDIADVTMEIVETNPSNSYCEQIFSTQIKPTYEDGKFVARKTLTFDYILDQFYQIKGSDGGYYIDASTDDFSFRFTATDSAGNISTTYIYDGQEYSDFISLYFSGVPQFDSEITSSAPLYNEQIADCYLVGSAFEFKGLDDLTTSYMKASVVRLPNKTKKNLRDYYEAKTDTEVGYEITNVNGGKKQNYSKVRFTQPGLYEVMLYKEGMYSGPYKFYITNNTKEETANYLASQRYDLLAVNSLYQLNSEARFYYWNYDSGKPASESYNGCSEPLFSTPTAAKEFITIHEYEDMHLIQLTPEDAEWLRTGSTANMVKANGEESNIPSTGQWWIRYKNSSWTVGTTVSGAWGYYYYGSSTDDVNNTININKLSTNITTVVKKVAQTLSAMNTLVRLVGGDHISAKTGEPKLTESQKSITRQFALTSTRSGNAVVGANYAGDTEVYSSSIEVDLDGENLLLPLATNLQINYTNETVIYIGLYSKSGVNYQQVNVKDGTPLKDVIKKTSEYFPSGVYSIIELDPNGAKEYKVYVDLEKPAITTIRSIYDVATGETSLNNLAALDGSSSPTFFSTQFTIREFLSSDVNPVREIIEIDNYAYVAIYRSTKLVYFSYIKDLSEEINLPEGNYDVTVGDRSGNIYSFKVMVATSDIDVKYTNSSGTKLKMEVTNRESGELLKFNVYLNDELISNSLEKEKVFTQNGEYTIEILDRYGIYYYEEGVTFVRDLPTVKFYYSVDGAYYTYREGVQNDYMIMSDYGEVTNVYTCGPIQIQYDPNAATFVVENAPEDCYTVTQDGKIKFTTMESFDIVFYSLASKEDYIKYSVHFDDLPPAIYGTYQVPSITGNESLEENYNVNKGIPNNLDYFVNYEGGKEVYNSSSIQNGETICTDMIHFYITDATKVNHVVITLNGEVLEDIINTTKLNDIEVYIDAIPGNYVVAATDIFGISTSLKFTVRGEIFTDATVDGNEVGPVGPLVDNNHIDYYGHSNAEIKVPFGSDIYLIIDSTKGTGSLTIQYTPTGFAVGDLRRTGVGETPSQTLIDYKDIETLKLYGVSFKYNADGTITVRFDNESEFAKLMVRVSVSSGAINLYNFEFSNVLPTVDFKDENGALALPQGGYIYCAEYVTLENYSEGISKVEVAYNPLSENFNDIELVPYTSSYVFPGEGFYMFVLTNKYGNQKAYKVIISGQLMVTVTEFYKEKDSQTYNITYADEYFSNRSVTIVGYSLTDLYADNGGQVSINGDKMTLTLNRPGVYTVTIIDINGHVKTIDVTIGSERIVYNEDWITGYNEKAVLKEDGYTNEILSIDLTQSAIQRAGIEQIFFIYNEQKVILYGYDEVKGFISYDRNKLDDCIGALGNGIYEVYFSNIFGDVVIKEINFSTDPTISISRLTNMDLDPELISLNDALTNGIWSNLRVYFNTDLYVGEYIFQVKSGNSDDYVDRSISYAFAISNAASTGEVHYYVYYCDAYGNEYEFEVNLIKRNLEFPLNDVKLVNNFEGNLTRENFTFEYDETEYVVTYTFNGGSKRLYNNKEIMYRDGDYVFYMEDKCGNKAIYTIKKDSIVEFNVKSATYDSLFYGQVVNDQNVEISSLGDDQITIVSMKLNGEIITGEIENRLSKTGHYEFIVQDQYGNLDYFHFYLVNNELKDFTYNTPDDYVIVSVYYIDAQGIKVTAMDKTNGAKNKLDLSKANEGTYEVTLRNKIDNSTTTFSIVISKAEPNAVLTGVEEGGVTTNNVSLTNLEVGDIVEIYRDGELIDTIEVGANKKIAAITEGGKYRLVVTNKAGVQKEYLFEKITIANAALSILIIAGLIAVSGGFFIGLLFRNRAKSDN